MNSGINIPEPLLFNPLKHHLGYIKEFVTLKAEEGADTGKKDLTKELKHLGTSVMDVYSGTLTISRICKEIIEHLEHKNLIRRETYSEWTGVNVNDFRVIAISDSSHWTLKYHNNESRYIHIFPARSSPQSFRVKSNTLKSAVLYSVLIGKDFITADDLNKVRPLLGLSPIKDPVDTEAITEMIEILRASESSF